MSVLPFSISPEASSWIAEILKIGKENPNCTGLIPVLYFALDYQKRDAEDRIFERCSLAFFNIAWDSAENALAEGCVKAEVHGIPFFVDPDALEALKGKELVVQAVEVGYPRSADREVRLLRAHPD